MIKRYCLMGNFATSVESPGGNWVKYSDHIEEMDRLAAEYESRIAELKTEIDQLQSKIPTGPLCYFAQASEAVSRIDKLEKENMDLKDEIQRLREYISDHVIFMGVRDGSR